jgi:hypothetical protein
MSEPKVIPSPEEIHATFATVQAQIAGMDLCLDATIDDYPIGRRERGKCRLQVERSKGKGYRTVRTTTNKHGRWCAPKKSTFSSAVHVVVRGYGESHNVVWLSVGNPAAQYGGAHVCIRYANGEGIALAKCWRNDPPQRTDHRYTTTEYEVTNLANILEGQVPRPIKTTAHVLEADSPEECDAWDVWTEELLIVRGLLADVWNRHEHATSLAVGAELV